jgi:hypothetical protein
VGRVCGGAVLRCGVDVDGPSDRAVILACEMIDDEVRLALTRTRAPAPLVWIPAGLHEEPTKLRDALQELIDALDEAAEQGTVAVLPSVRPGKGPAELRLEWVEVGPSDDILLALGYCGNGLNGLTSRSHRVAFPRVDDCISLFLNHGCTREEIVRDARAFYLTRGWLCHDNPLLRDHAVWQERFGPEKARRLRRASMAAYERITLIDTGAYEVAESLPASQDLAQDLELAHTVVSGSVSLLEKLFAGPWDSEIAAVDPGTPLSIWHLFGED